MRRLLLAPALLLALAAAAVAQEDTSEEVRLPTGSDRLLIANSLTGEQSREYALEVGAGQTLSLRFETMALGTFTVVGPEGNLLFNGRIAETATFTRALPAAGLYRVRVFLGGQEAASGRTVAFQLSMRVSG